MSYTIYSNETGLFVENDVIEAKARYEKEKRYMEDVGADDGIYDDQMVLLAEISDKRSNQSFVLFRMFDDERIDAELFQISSYDEIMRYKEELERNNEDDEISYLTAELISITVAEETEEYWRDEDVPENHPEWIDTKIWGYKEYLR